MAQASSGVSDPEVLRLAADQDLVLITEDRDFGELVIRQRLPVHGVILTELDRLSSAGAADRIEKCIIENTKRLRGNLVVIEPGRIRIRPLPQSADG